MTRWGPTRFLGPGLVSAAANNDPTTVATLAMIGATTGYGLCWLVIVVFPALALIQRLAAGVGAASTTSLQGAIRRRCGLRWAVVTLCSVAAVNVITLVADVRAGSEALGLLTRLPPDVFIVPFVVLTGGLLVGHSYARVERYLLVLPLVFLAYVGSALLAHPDWGALLRGILAPNLEFALRFLPATVALLGTTLTAYVYLWESIGAAERSAQGVPMNLLRRDAVQGMVLVGIVFVFIVIANAATLGLHHVHIESAADAAAALVPLAGPASATLFAVGLFGSAMLAVPVLASTTAYVAAHTFGWSGRLDDTVREAPRFYATVVAVLALAGALAFLPVLLIPLLFAASVAGGLATPITLYFLVRLSRDERVMGAQRIGKPLAVTAWAITAVVAVADVLYLVSGAGLAS